jgi:hypothetical protein
MGDPIAIASIILAVGTTLGGLFGYWHLKLKSDCCKCCQLECSEKQNQKKLTISPPMSPIKLTEPKIKEQDITTISTV